MVDVSAKAQTRRTATAQAFVKIKPSVLKKLPQNPKGDPLEVARFAGISAAKRTSDLLRDPERATEMGTAGREHVRKNFLSTRELEDWLRLFTELR